MAFAAGDVSLARAELAGFKDFGRAERECASQVWKSGVAELIARDAWRGAAPLLHQGHRRRHGNDSAVWERRAGVLCAADAADTSWLDIPRIQEVLVCVQTKERQIILEQDGFLRAFDMSSVLWPPGFFLTLWSAANCPALEGRRILELGAGVGAPSIASALCGAGSVLATDKDAHALVNIQTNAEINGVSVRTELFDWSSEADTAAIMRGAPYDVVLGAGLAPHRWAEELFNLLARLLKPGTGKAYLTHGTDEIVEYLPTPGGELADGMLRLDEVIVGDRFGLQTRWGKASEFELVVLSRTPRAPRLLEDL